jgi:hypothetical protein
LLSQIVPPVVFAHEKVIMSLIFPLNTSLFAWRLMTTIGSPHLCELRFSPFFSPLFKFLNFFGVYKKFLDSFDITLLYLYFQNYNDEQNQKNRKLRGLVKKTFF